MQRLERKVEILTRLAEISTVLNSTLELKPLLEHLMDCAADITNADAASVLLWDDRRHELYIAATTTNTAELQLAGIAVPLAGSIAGTIMSSQAPVVVNDTLNDVRHYRQVDNIKGYETRSILGVPLTARDRPMGVLEVINKRDLPWTDDDLNYLSILASQAAVAIQSAQQMVKLRKANKELNELAKLKNDFIALASHELRTPLGVILGYASFLQETTDTQVSEHATKVVNSALQLRGIIENLTNLRYLKEGTADVQPQLVPVSGIIEDAVGDVITLCNAKGHTLTVESASDDPVVYVDPIHIAMALTNILNNAVRFTSDGGTIVVTTRLHETGEVWVSVIDNGIGINEDNLEKVFEEFYQVEDHMTRKQGGLGIGLSIARVLVQFNGGRIWASSKGPGRGAIFTLTLPLAKDGETR